MADKDGFIPAHGGYEDLLAFQKARLVYDGTVAFCGRFLKKRDRTIDQMVQAAHSGKQNILEGSQASGTSKEMEIKLINGARASQEELLEDYRDYLRRHGLKLWAKDSREALYVRRLGSSKDTSYESYRTYIETRPPDGGRQYHDLPHPPGQLPARSAAAAAGGRLYQEWRPAGTHDPRPAPESRIAC
jgi:hypothetical protein